MGPAIWAAVTVVATPAPGWLALSGTLLARKGDATGLARNASAAPATGNRVHGVVRVGRGRRYGRRVDVGVEDKRMRRSRRSRAPLDTESTVAGREGEGGAKLRASTGASAKLPRQPRARAPKRRKKNKKYGDGRARGKYGRVTKSARLQTDKERNGLNLQRGGG
ncbi:hypothetical protein SYNPS1DRAFT_30012 [Syncephalis pseudoplumigaleata]|uniref:Uncharacterized protein n=1 Tax=Syncephalis pseudoplumigaleata TaxID=1712513 RepID=A0A4P9YY12_9FUNG|nr:hypothetical protein SYNPS1DRAFT_30012 [Syncephalis pseudoplumigaleata]|eukprot:RKP24221.1 hypothetical protein SYNPS1DRAFT_30012 [Syncephalis pseudoplumigaleata]